MWLTALAAARAWAAGLDRKALARYAEWALGLLCIGLVVLAIVLMQRASARQYERGRLAGLAECSSTVNAQTALATARQAQGAASATQARIDRAASAGAAQERVRTRIVTVFQTLESEARHDAPDPVDRCVLPADRLRRWTDANRGPAAAGAAADRSAAPQPDPASAASAPAAQRRDAGPGGESP